MPKRTDIRTILIIGSGPIVIGQGCEFDYSGTQACKALREEGYQIVLVNSNPATIMTDPEFSDRTYIEPITPETVTRIIETERGGPFQIDALLPTLGGQTALNCACQLDEEGVLKRFGIEMIGATREVIYRAEDRRQFKDIIESIGLRCPRAGIANSMDEALAVLEGVGLPAIIRPAFTLGGTGGGVAYDRDQFAELIQRGLDASMNSQVLIDQSLLGWKEYELEVMRDRDDNAVIVCAIENFDPMGVHTGDSITVAPAQTLTDKEYQRMRDAALAIIRAVGVETGGSNIQFAINPSPADPSGAGEMVVIEMNPRVSRSSALASKATGFPIAKIAAKLAVGYLLWELPNDVTGETVACFEPSIDYVVTKIPRWTFEKFPEADETLTTQMKSVGEAMSIGRTFKESLQKGVRSMEIKRFGLGLDANDQWLSGPASAGPAGPTHFSGSGDWPIDEPKLRRKLEVPSQGRLYFIRYAFKMGWSIEQVRDATKIDPWFLDQVKQLCDFEAELLSRERLEEVDADLMLRAKQLGYSDPQLANLYLGAITTDTILRVRAYRKKLGIEPVYKLVDTCAAEFEASTPYYYSTYETPFSRDPKGSAYVDDEIRVSDKPKVIILGGGPNRIGQGIEFDYCCVQAAFAADELGFESVMINSNPETVSTDYDTSDLLFFEPLTLEDVLNICERLNGGPFSPPAEAGGAGPTHFSGSGNGSGGLVHGVIVQFGGQTPLNLAHGLQKAGVPILGTSVASIDRAEDRDSFQQMLQKLGLLQPENGIAYDLPGSKKIAADIGYPVLVRPSYVLGGRGMEICNTDDDLERYMASATAATDLTSGGKNPILIDKFLKLAIECDVDCVADFGSPRREAEGKCVVAGVMEHIEEAGIHSGDSGCALPPYTLSPAIVDELKQQTARLAEELSLCGLMNVQYAIKDEVIYVIEVNPRASRTVPFVSKATGVPWARIATKAMLGCPLRELMNERGLDDAPSPAHVSVKESVFPFNKFPGVDVILGPEMRSTGEVMGIDTSFALAFAKGQIGSGWSLPTEGNVLLSVNDPDKKYIVGIGRDFAELGFKIYATVGTRRVLREAGVDAELVSKTPPDDATPYLLEMIRTRQLHLLINTPLYIGSHYVEGKWRAASIIYQVPLITTISGARAAVGAVRALRAGRWDVCALQDYACPAPSLA